MEPCALSFNGFCYNVAIVVLGDLFAHSQPDTGACIFGFTVEALENVEDLVSFLWIETDTVVFERYPVIKMIFF